MRLMHNVVPPAAIRHSTARYAACTDLQSGLILLIISGALMTLAVSVASAGEIRPAALARSIRVFRPSLIPSRNYET